MDRPRPGLLLIALAACIAGPSVGLHAATLEDDATAFGRLPAMWNVEISPTGRRVVYLAMHPSDVPVARVIDFESSEVKQPLASEPGAMDVTSCQWATDDRLVCSFVGVSEQWSMTLESSRPIAVDWDGSDVKAYMSVSQRDTNLAQFRAQVVDWLVDDPDRVLVNGDDELRHGARDEKFALGLGGAGGALSAVDIETGRMKAVVKSRGDYRGWITDGRGNPRARLRIDPDEHVTEYRASDQRGYEAIGRQSASDPHLQFAAVGFASDTDRLVVLQRVAGRLGLWSLEPEGTGPGERLFEDPDNDVLAVQKLGPHQRVSGALIAQAWNELHGFDPRSMEVAHAVGERLSDHRIDVLSESWDGRTFVVVATPKRGVGSILRFDSQTGDLIKLSSTNPDLEGRELAPSRRIELDVPSGGKRAFFVTVPGKRVEGGRPTVILPFGGADSRNVLNWDWLAQFLAARGYVVLQTPHGGRLGPNPLLEAGSIQSWRQELSEIDSFVQLLVEKGVTDPSRICAVGWGYGAYVALMQALERPESVRCVAGIASLTDPEMVVDQWRNFSNRIAMRKFVGDDPAVTERGSPLERASEFAQPVLLFHGENDATILADQSEKLASALKDADKDVELVVYPDTEHSLDRNAARIDMLTRLGHFLAEHLAQPPESALSASGPGGVASSKR